MRNVIFLSLLAAALMAAVLAAIGPAPRFAELAPGVGNTTEIR